MSFRPAYFQLSLAEIRRRADEAVAALARCEVCPRNCGVDRLVNEARVCATGRYARVSTWFAHFGEEDCLRGKRGSGTIFFSFCNLRCVFCFHPDTFVATDDGLVRISDLFESCHTTTNTPAGAIAKPKNLRAPTRTLVRSRVTKLFAHEHEGELLSVKAYSCPPLLLTGNHEVFAAHRSDLTTVEPIRADALTHNHFLVVPKRTPRGERVVLDSSALLANASTKYRRRRERRISQIELTAALSQDVTSEELGLALGYHPAYVRTLKSRARRGQLWLPDQPTRVLTEGEFVRFEGEHRPGIPSSVELDCHLAWLLGIFCAEGHVARPKDRPNSYRLIFSFGQHEQALAARTAQLLATTFGVLPRQREHQTTLTVECGKSSLALWFEALCGTGAHKKRVPSVLRRSTPEILRSFLDGYLAGDGTERPKHRVGNTVSLELAYGLFELGLHLSMLPSFHEWDAPEQTNIEGRTVRQSTLYYVKFKRDRLDGTADASQERTKWKDMGSAFLVPVHRVERVPYRGPVYNLEIDNTDHSYLAPFVAVKNCQNHDTSQAGQGRELSPAELAAAMLDLQKQGCHNINFVTPEHVVPQILEALPIAIERGLTLPIVYNTSSYDSMESLGWMDGIVDIYMPDFKLWTKPSAIRYLKAKDYRDVACRIVKEMHRQVGPLVIGPDGLAQRGVLVRHLVMPGLLDETREIFRFLATEISPDTYVNVMGQYRPEYRANEYAEINRRPTAAEMDDARRLFYAAGLSRIDQRRPSRLSLFG
jgi:putative pyruvate formate lyase activating enzyme